MSLLELKRVSKLYGRGMCQRVVLRDVSLEIEPGEVVAVWGRRRSGRSTLLRIAAGVEAPDSGVVRFAGRDMSRHGAEMLGGGIGYCRKAFPPSEGTVVLDQLIVGQIARGIAPSLAATRARAGLERAGVEHCAALRPSELDCAEAVRVAVARALTLQPRLLLIDEPTMGVDLGARDGILRLLHSLASDGTAVLTSTGESTGLSGARALTLGEGELHGSATRELATVVPLRRPA
ncbi:MAG TPA: ATP-binding cassette domain-containing protein [Solirubrobacteraceae bacterium]|nr:ATP-binding cassette domain-containing protein [Solirubrobacteraceae bacterium]